MIITKLSGDEGDDLETFHLWISLMNHLELAGFYALGFPRLRYTAEETEETDTSDVWLSPIGNWRVRRGIRNDIGIWCGELRRVYGGKLKAYEWPVAQALKAFWWEWNRSGAVFTFLAHLPLCPLASFGHTATNNLWSVNMYMLSWGSNRFCSWIHECAPVLVSEHSPSNAFILN